MNQEFNIVDFPREIIEHIFSFILDTKGYTSFRQTCWYIYQCSQFVKHFYPSGQLRLRVPIKKHRINGHVVGYHYNDALKYVGLFLNSEKEGIHRYFYSDNKLMFTGNFKNNHRQGYHYWYHSNGCLERFNKYVDDKKEYKEVVYHPDGSFRWIINYYKNNITGTAEFYKDSFNNVKYLEIPVKQGEINGLVVLYNFNGFIQYQGIIKDGHPVGIHKTYYNNGRIKKITEFKNGQLNGYQKEFYSNGSLKSIVKYKNNLKDSRETVWHNKTGVKSSVRYSKNKKQGYFMKYNFFGQLDKKSYYTDDKITGLTELYSRSGLQFRSYNDKCDVLVNYLDGKYSTVFFRDSLQNTKYNKDDVTNSYSYFIDGKIKNKTYIDPELKSNHYYNIFGEIISDTVIIQNFVKTKKITRITDSDSDDSLVQDTNAGLNAADKVLMIPI